MLIVPGQDHRDQHQPAGLPHAVRPERARRPQPVPQLGRRRRSKGDTMTLLHRVVFYGDHMKPMQDARRPDGLQGHRGRRRGLTEASVSKFQERTRIATRSGRRPRPYPPIREANGVDGELGALSRISFCSVQMGSGSRWAMAVSNQESLRWATARKIPYCAAAGERRSCR